MKHIRFSAGFTMVEMIVVIVITGIIAGMVAVFIRSPIESYIDSVRRAELTDQADVALRRMTRDIRLALPNSLRQVPNGFELIMTKSGGRYRDESDGSTAGNILSFSNSSRISFDVLGPLPMMEAGDRMVVYNLGQGYAPADAYSGQNVATIASIAGNTVTLTANPFATQSPPLPSPSSRFQIVDRNDLVVRYVCSNGELRRFAACTLASPSTCSGTGAVLAGSASTEPKASCDIDYTSAETGRNGLLYISLTLRHTPSDEAIILFQQIHVDNSP